MARMIFLLRHAKSSWDDPSLPDHDRPLSKRGRKAAAAMREFLRSEKICPDLVWVSSARRTRETLEALRPFDHAPKAEVKPALYMASAQRMVELLRQAPEGARALLLIGHNPGLEELAVLLAGDGAADEPLVRRLREKFPTGALAEFNFDGPWRRLGPGAGKLTRFVAPRSQSKSFGDISPITPQMRRPFERLMGSASNLCDQRAALCHRGHKSQYV